MSCHSQGLEKQGSTTTHNNKITNLFLYDSMECFHEHLSRWWFDEPEESLAENLPKDTILKFFNTYRLIDGDDEWAVRACVNWYKTGKSVHDCVSILASDYETEWYAQVLAIARVSIGDVGDYDVAYVRWFDNVEVASGYFDEDAQLEELMWARGSNKQKFAVVDAKTPSRDAPGRPSRKCDKGGA